MEAGYVSCFYLRASWGMSQSVTRLLLGILGSGWDPFSLGDLRAAPFNLGRQPRHRQAAQKSDARLRYFF